MKLKFNKKWWLLSLAPLAVFSVAGVSSCGQVTPKEDLTAYKALLWQISPEHVAHELNVFKNATRQYDEVINKNVTTQPQTWAVKEKDSSNNEVDHRAFKATKIPNETGTEQNADKYTVTYASENADKITPVVVVDLDETFISNTMNGIYNALHGGFKPDVFQKWVDAAKAPIYAGVINFVEHVWESGGVVLFDSNRNMGDFGGSKTGDQLSSTRQNLINDGYPEAFLDSYTWWMNGVIKYNEQKQTAENVKELSSKEDRYNYINANKLQTRTADQMGLLSDKDKKWDDQIKLGDKKLDAKAEIVMKMGDDLDDFNSNFLASGEAKDHLKARQDYMANQNIQDLFGGVAPAVWFDKDENAKPVEHVASGVAKIDDNLKNELAKDPVQETLKLYQTYCYVGGNSDYGHWLGSFEGTYGKDVQGIKDALLKYFDDHGGKTIFPESDNK